MKEVLGFLTGLVAMVVPGFGTAPEPVYTGYIEADYVYAAPASPGTIESIAVNEGDVVKKGDLLFTLSSTQQQALVRAAEARVTAARANWENLVTGGREEEIEVVRASLDKAEADLALAQSTAERSRKLFDVGSATQARVDQDQSALASAKAQVEQLKAQLAVAELPARGAEQIAAEANLLAAEADADKARSDLLDRTVYASADGQVETVYFDEGEMAAAGVPVLSLLPVDAMKVRFYVAEADRSAFTLGETLAVTCDGCPQGLQASLTQLASEPQFTAPIIYSRDERSRLVYLAEATLDHAGGLLPGQPVTVVRQQ
jgi:HlyD family secretion protein